MSSPSSLRHDVEKLSINDLGAIMRDRDRDFRSRLDEADAGQAALHQEALLLAASQHARVREKADRVRQQFIIEEQTAQRQRELEEQEALEEARRRLVAQDEQLRKARVAAEQQRQRDEERQAAEQQAAQRQTTRRPSVKLHAPGVPLSGQQPSQTTTRIDQPVQASKAAPPSVTAQSQPPALPPPQKITPTTTGVAPSQTSNGTQKAAVSDPSAQTSSRDAEHKEYLDLHKRLKVFRRQMASLGKQEPQLKSLMGDGRREITKKVGQMTAGASEEAKQANRGRVMSVRSLLLQALQHSQPSFDIRTFLVSSRRIDSSETDLEISGLFMYLLNIFTKSVVKQYIGEAGISPEKAEPVGLLLATIFGQQALQWRGTTYLIDVLLAKYHKTCPVLFGIYGPANTAAGRARSGWLPGFTAQENSERMTGLGAGFASITLRDFSKSASKNPMPVSLLWRALATIVNTPAREAGETHFLVLKALLDPVYVQKLVRFYGDAALALLRRAVLDFPAHSNTVAANALKVLPDLYKRQIDLVLAL